MQPYFHSVSTFVTMGNHGVFVWSSWGITLAIMLTFVVYSRRQRQALIKQLTIQQIRQAQRSAIPSALEKKPSAAER